MSSTESQIWPLDPSSIGSGLPLEGIRVLDLSRVLAGPLAAMIAGDLGADVVKVEQPGGDPVRAMKPPSVDGVATYYLAVNRNRRSVVVDLASEEGRRQIVELAACADVVIENFLPSQAQALGITALREQLVDVVWVTVAAAAAGGPLADQPAFDLLAQARGGLMGVTGSLAGGPTKVGAPLADVVTGLYAAIGMLAGLFDRVVRPERAARRIEAPLLESTISALVNQAAGYLATGVAPALLGNEHPSIAPYAPFDASDGEILLAVGTEGQWASLCRALDAEKLRLDPRFESNDARVEHRDELRAELNAVFANGRVEEWIERLTRHRVPCAPVNDVASALSQQQIAGGDMIVEVELEGGPVRMLASPLRVDGRRLPVRQRPPSLGEHNELLKDRIGER